VVNDDLYSTIYIVFSGCARRGVLYNEGRGFSKGMMFCRCKNNMFQCQLKTV